MIARARHAELHRSPILLPSAPVLHLASRTPAHWSAWACEHPQRLDEILLDHAHCEKKAASTAIGLVFRYQDHPALMLPLSRLAREELEHFELVLSHVERRGSTFHRLRPSPYASRLLTIVRPQEPHRLLDTLMGCAMIEARSCERMQRLAEALEAHPDHALHGMYRALLACEARHHTTYLDLARTLTLVEDDAFERRLADVAAHEADVITHAPCEPRLHGGAPSP